MLTALAGAAGALALARAARRGAVSQRTLLRARSVPRQIAVPPPLSARVTRALDRADLPWAVADAVLWWGVSGTAVAILSLAVFGLTGALVGLALGMAGPPVALWVLRHRRHQRLGVLLPDLLEDIARDVRAGGTVNGAIDRIGSQPTLLGREIARVRARTELGLGLDDALASWARGHVEGPVAELVACTAAGLQVSLVTGGRAASSLDGLAASMRDSNRAAGDARANAAQGRLSAWLLGALPVASLVLSAALDPESSSALIHHPLGRICLAAGLSLEAIGLVWMRRVIRVPA